MNANKLGVLIGSFYAAWHAGWSALVAAGVAKPLLDWILRLHFLSFEYVVYPFDAARAATLVLAAFVSGYVIGWVLGTGWKAFTK